MKSRVIEGYPVVEYDKGPPDPGVHHPGLWFRQQGCLNDRIVECSRDLGVCPIPPQNPGQPHPFPTQHHKIGNHRHSLGLSCGEDLPKVCK